jgi:hypothetical protein
MKFYLLIAGTVLSLSACKTSQNAYKQAYEKAKGTYGRFAEAAKYIDPRKE